MELENFKFNKKFGQNFISDKNLLKAIVSDSEITENDEILEIGTGAGTLTLAIAEKAKKVVSYEIDKKLTEFLNEKFKNAENVKIIIDNVLNLPIKKKKLFKFLSYNANLPYYLTTPLIFKFLKNKQGFKYDFNGGKKKLRKKLLPPLEQENMDFKRYVNYIVR